MLFALPKPVLDALRRLTAGGHEAYLVGGCVRDDCLGIPPKDYDICTSAIPGQVHACFAGEPMADTGIKHGTVTVILQGMPLEITTFRKDLDYKDGRHPEGVIFTKSLVQDLSRRDFTINAMAWHMDTGLIDPFGGREDCRCKCIACVGEPAARFGEDALRILRAMRFASALGFSILPSTAKTMHGLRERLEMVSRERVCAEMSGLLAGADPGSVLAEFYDILLKAVPQAAALPEIWTGTVKALRNSVCDVAVRWALLFSGCGLPEEISEGGYPPESFRESANAQKASEALASLRASNALIQEVELLAGFACARIQPGTVRKWLSRITPETFDRLIALKRAMAAGFQGTGIDENSLRDAEAEKEHVIRLGLCTSLRQLAVNGRDMAALGYRDSGIGDVLDRLLDRVLSDEAPNEREPLLALAAGWQEA